MSCHALLLHAQKKVQRAALAVRVPIALLVDAVDERVVDVVGAERGELQVQRTLYRFRVRAPAVLAVRVVRAEMHLIQYFVAHAAQRLAHPSERHRVARREVEIIDAPLVSLFQRGDGFRLVRLAYRARAQPDDAYAVARASVRPVFHVPSFRPCPHILYDDSGHLSNTRCLWPP